MYVPSATLEGIKLFQNLFRLNLKGEIHRPTMTPTPTGNSLVYAPVSVNVDMGIATGPAGESQYEGLIGERFGQAIPTVLLFDWEQDIEVKDIVYQTVPMERSFEVLAIPTKGISYETLRRVIAVERT